MTDAPYQRLFDTARAHLPGAMDGGMHLELFNTLREFLNRSNIWVDEIPFRTSNTRQGYEITTAQPSALINRLMWIEGKRDPRGSYTHAYPTGVSYRGQLIGAGKPTAEIVIDGLPGQGEIWYAHVALVPTDPTGPTGLPRIPDDIIDGHFETILSGLLERMMIQPSKPYSNIQGASYHGHRFRAGTNQAKNAHLHGDVFRGQAWRYPRTFRSRTQTF